MQWACTGENTFYFGCRHEKKDFLYGELWREMVASGVLHNFHTAFSRDQVCAIAPSPSYTRARTEAAEQEEKVYVQHKLLENAEHTWDAIANHQAHFYVSGYFSL